MSEFNFGIDQKMPLFLQDEVLRVEGVDVSRLLIAHNVACLAVAVEHVADALRLIAMSKDEV